MQAAVLTLFLLAQLSGEVLDPTGAVIPGATISLAEPQTNSVFRMVSGPTGSYLFFPLKPGIYRATVEASGFQRVVHQTITVATGEHIRLDFRLQVGETQESLIVTADAPLLRTDSANLGQVVDASKILELPLNGRSFVTLAQLAPGVALPPGSTLPRINGGRPRVNEYLYDGISVLQPEPGQVAFMPIIDAIREFKVETNSPSAEFGRFNGGVVNLTMKSGSNEFHGSAFEFLRNEALNARNLFAPATTRFRRNQFGFVLGGPIARDKTFFFADYQGSRQSVGRVRTSTVPTVVQRQGVFTERVGTSVPAVYDPSTREPFPNNTIPVARMDPVALGLLGRYPLPTSAGTANNFTRIGNEGEDQNQGDFRVDHHFGDSHQAFARISRFVSVQDPVTPLPDGGGILTTGAPGRTRTVGDSFASRYLRSFASQLTNELRVGYTRRSVHSASIAMPTYAITGYQQLGPSVSAFSKARTDVTQLADTLSFQRGAHFLKAGLDFRWQRMDIIQPPSPAGLFSFSAAQTGISSAPTSGSALASFLLGQVDRFSIDVQQKPLRPRAAIQEFFIQDDWKVSRRLTVNAGLRYTLNFPSTEVDDQGAVFNLRTQQLDYLGQSGFPRSSRELHKLNFGPRLGLAYRPGEKIVLRSAYGIVWIEQSGITTPFTNPYFPFIQTVTQRSLDNVSPAFILAAGPSTTTPVLTPDAMLGQGAFTVDRNLGSGYVQQWNVSIQHELTENTLVEVAYTGSKITHVGIPDTNVNQLTKEQLSLGLQLLQPVPNPYFGEIPRSSSLGGPVLPLAQLLKPYPRFTNIAFFRNNVGNTNYNGFQAKAEKRFSNGLSALASYTWSKLIDEASSVFDASILTGPTANFPVADTHNRKLERDVSTGDIANVLVASASYDLPLSGWQVSGILTLQSGVPLALTQATNFNSFAGFGTQRPNRIADPKLPRSERSTARFFDTSAFVVAPQFTLGSSSRNPVRGPGFQCLDIAVVKRIALGERKNVEVRAEVFNVTNTPPLGAPNVVLGSAAFGTITSAGDPRIVQLGLKLNL